VYVTSLVLCIAFDYHTSCSYGVRTHPIDLSKPIELNLPTIKSLSRAHSVVVAHVCTRHTLRYNIFAREDCITSVREKTVNVSPNQMCIQGHGHLGWTYIVSTIAQTMMCASLSTYMRFVTFRTYARDTYVSHATSITRLWAVSVREKTVDVSPSRVDTVTYSLTGTQFKQSNQ
jgi:hypothetical protein